MTDFTFWDVFGDEERARDAEREFLQLFSQQIKQVDMDRESGWSQSEKEGSQGDPKSQFHIPTQSVWNQTN